MIRLTKEQLENLERYYDLKTRECEEFTEINKATSKPIVCSAKDGYEGTDDLTIYQKGLAEGGKRFAEYVRDNAQTIEVVEDGKVNLGTTFKATIEFQGTKSTAEKTLVETSLPSDDYKKYISLESTVGKAILGRTEGETFKYKQKDRYGDVNEITITINEIIKTKKLSR